MKIVIDCIILTVLLITSNFSSAQTEEQVIQYQNQQQYGGENQRPDNLPAPESQVQTPPTVETQQTQQNNTDPVNTVTSGTEAQEFSSDAPVPLQYADPSVTSQSGNFFVFYSVIAAAVVFGFVWFGWWRRWLQRNKTKALPAEKEGEEKETVCPTCGGSGTITKKRNVSAPCLHCKETGIDICHHCSGTGRNGLGYGIQLEDIENYPKCEYCGGKGFPELVLQCCMCKGKRKEVFEESYKETCPTCKGSGTVAK